MLLEVMVVAIKPRPGGDLVVVKFTTKMNDILEQMKNAPKITQATQVQKTHMKLQPHRCQLGVCVVLNMRNLL
jgi:hypothetical protein